MQPSKRGFTGRGKIESRMNRRILVSVAYIACRLIAGKRITSLYDIDGARDINVKESLDAEFIKEFDERQVDHIRSRAKGRMYEYKPGTGHPIEIFIDKRNFIIHVKGSSAYFIGNVQKDVICFYNHRDETHFKYEIKGWSEEEPKHRPSHHAHTPALAGNAGLF